MIPLQTPKQSHVSVGGEPWYFDYNFIGDVAPDGINLSATLNNLHDDAAYTSGSNGQAVCNVPNWQTGSEHTGNLIGDLDFEFTFNNQRTKIEGAQVTLQVPNWIVAAPNISFDMYGPAGPPQRTFRFFGDNGTNFFKFVNLSSAYDAVKEFIIRATRRGNVWVVKLYRSSDMLVLATLTHTLTGSDATETQAISQVQMFPEQNTVSTNSNAKSGKLYPGDLLFPGGI